MSAIAYKNGITQTELTEWFGVEHKTIYNWLTRIEDGNDFVAAVVDAPRSGRPRKLSDEDQQQLALDLHILPSEHDFSAADWTAELLQEHIESKFGVHYSISSCRRLFSDIYSQ